MIGVFDSGIGGLTVLRTLAARFPHVSFVYLADHANVPYGNRTSAEIVEMTRRGTEHLFRLGAGLVLLGCNTATAVAARTLQRDWLAGSASGRPWPGRNVLGIVAPTVEAATQTPWAVTSPQYPQKYNADVIAVFGTVRTVSSGVYPEEISKRCPRVTVLQQACADLAGAIENKLPEHELDQLVGEAVNALIRRNGGAPPHRAILGCTHFPIVEPLFRRHLPAHTRILSQPEIVADSLEDYLARHPEFLEPASTPGVRLLTTGNPSQVDSRARVFWRGAPPFDPIIATVGVG
jgi:glutamate racemase